MPSLDDATTTRSGPLVTVRASAPVELCWALHAALKPEFRLAHPALQALYDEHPELLEQAASFWDDDASPGLGFLEFLVLAHQGDALFAVDLGGLFAELDTVSSRRTPTCRWRRRAPRTARSSSTAWPGCVARRGCATAMAPCSSRCGAPSAPAWQQWGRRAVEAVCADKRDQLAPRGAQWPEIIRIECDIGDLPARAWSPALGTDGELAVVPAYFTHKSMLFDLPGLVVVGVRADPSGAESRARTQSLARRLKTLADPTRLGIIDHLVQGPSTVTELARHFGIAQPTASNHVKLLRDAGLVTEVRSGSRRQLELDPATVRDLLDHLRAVLEPTLGDVEATTHH